MVTHLPHGLQKLLEVTVGMPWPEGSEDDLWDLARAWSAFAGELSALGDDLITEANNYSQVIQGTTGDSIRDVLATDLHDGAIQLQEQAEAYSKMLKNVAADIQKTKIMIIVMLGILAGTIASLLASLFGALAVPSVVAAARLGIGIALRALMTRLMEVGLLTMTRELAMKAFIGAVAGAGFMVGLDAGIQGVQIAQGHRQGMDTTSLRGSAIGGAIGGALGGVAQGLVGIAGKVGRDLWRAMPRSVRAFGPLGSAFLQIPAAALSNPLINAATHSPGSAMEGIFGALDTGGGHSHAHVPGGTVKPLAPLRGVDLSGITTIAGRNPLPVKGANGTQVGTAFSTNPPPLTTVDKPVVDTGGRQGSTPHLTVESGRSAGGHGTPEQTGLSTNGRATTGEPTAVPGERVVSGGGVRPAGGAKTGKSVVPGGRTGTGTPAAGRGGDVRTGGEPRGVAGSGHGGKSSLPAESGQGGTGSRVAVPDAGRGADATAASAVRGDGGLRVPVAGGPSRLVAEGGAPSVPAEGGSGAVKAPEPVSEGNSAIERSQPVAGGGRGGETTGAGDRTGVAHPAAGGKTVGSMATTGSGPRGTESSVEVGGPSNAASDRPVVDETSGRSARGGESVEQARPKEITLSRFLGETEVPGGLTTQYGKPVGLPLSHDDAGGAAFQRRAEGSGNEAQQVPAAVLGHRGPVVATPLARVPAEGGRLTADVADGRKPAVDAEAFTKVRTTALSMRDPSGGRDLVATSTAGSFGTALDRSFGDGAARPEPESRLAADPVPLDGTSLRMSSAETPDVGDLVRREPAADSGTRRQATVTDPGSDRIRLAGQVGGQRFKFFADEVSHAPLERGGRVVGVTFTAGRGRDGALEWAAAPGSGERTALVPAGHDSLPVARQAGVVTERRSPWPHNVFFINAHAIPRRVAVTLGNGTEVGISGGALAYIAAQLPVFRAAVKEDRPAAFVLLSCAAGAVADGVAQMFQQTLGQSFKYDRPVIAPTGPLDLVTAGEHAGTTAVLGGGVWRMFTTGPAPLLGLYSGKLRFFRPEDIKGPEPLVDGERIVGISYRAEAEPPGAFDRERGTLFVAAEGTRDSFGVMHVSGRRLALDGEVFAQLVGASELFRRAVRGAGSITLLADSAGALRRPGGAATDFQRALAAAGHDRPVFAPVGVVTGDGRWHRFASGAREAPPRPVRAFDLVGVADGRERRFSLTDVDVAPLERGGRVVGVTFASGELRDFARRWAAQPGDRNLTSLALPGHDEFVLARQAGAVTVRRAPWPDNAFFVTGHADSGRFPVQLRDGARVAVDGEVLAGVLGQLPVFQSAVREHRPDAFVLVACATGATERGAAHRFQRTLAEWFGGDYDRPVVAPSTAVQAVISPDVATMVTQGGRWRMFTSGPVPLLGVDETNRARYVRAAEIAGRPLSAGERLLGITYRADGEGAQPAGGSTGRFFVAADGRPDSFGVLTTAGRKLFLDGDAFARLVRESAPFRRFQEETGTAPVVLLADSAGAAGRPGGAGWDFRNAFGHGEVFAPIETVTADRWRVLRPGTLSPPVDGDLPRPQAGPAESRSFPADSGDQGARLAKWFDEADQRHAAADAPRERSLAQWFDEADQRHAAADAPRERSADWQEQARQNAAEAADRARATASEAAERMRRGAVAAAERMHQRATGRTGEAGARSGDAAPESRPDPSPPELYGPAGPAERVHRARIDRPQVEGDVDGAGLRAAITTLLSRKDGLRKLVDHAFSDDNLKKDFDRVLEGGMVVDLGADGKGGQVTIEAVALSAPREPSKATASVSRENGGGPVRQRLQTVRGAVTTEPRAIRVPMPFVMFAAKVAGLVNMRGSELRSTTTREVKTKIAESEVEITTAQHDVTYRITVRKPGRHWWSKPVVQVGYHDVKTGLAWPDRTAAAPADDAVKVTPVLPDAVEYLEFSGLGQVYRAVTSALDTVSATDPETRRFRGWLDRLPASGRALFSGEPVRESFEFGGRKPVEVVVAIAAKDTEQLADVRGSVTHTRKLGVEHLVTQSYTRRWGAGLTVGFGDFIHQLGGYAGFVGSTYRNTKTGTVRSDEHGHELTRVYDGQLGKQRVELGYVVRAGDKPAVVVPGTATVWTRPGEPAPRAGTEPAATPVSEDPAGADRFALPDRVDARFRLPEAVVADIVGRVLHRLEATGRVRAKDLARLNERLRAFLAERAREVVQGGDGVRFPLSAWHKGAPDVFVRGVLQPEKARYLGVAESETLGGKVSLGHTHIVEVSKGVDRSRGLVGNVYKSKPASTVLNLQVTREQNHRDTGKSEHHVGIETSLKSAEPVHRFDYPAEFEVRTGGRWSAPGEVLHWRGGGETSGYPVAKIDGRVELTAANRGGDVFDADARARRDEETANWHDDATRPGLRAGSLPPGFALESLKPVPDLLGTVTAMLDAPAGTRWHDWLSTSAVGSRPPEIDQHKGRSIFEREEGEPDERNVALDELENFAAPTARTAQFERVALFQDTVRLKSHNQPGLLGSRELVARVDLSARMGNPRLIARDETHTFAHSGKARTTREAKAETGAGFKARLTVLEVKPVNRVLAGGAELAIGGGHTHTDGVIKIDSATVTERGDRVERGYLVGFDATYEVRTSARRDWGDVVGLWHQGTTRDQAKWIHLPGAVKIWVPAGEVHRVGELTATDVAKLEATEAERYRGERVDPVEPAGTTELAEPAAPTGEVRAPGNVGRGAGTVQLYRLEAGTELVRQVEERLKAWADEHRGPGVVAHEAHVKPAGTPPRSPFDPINDRLVHDVLGPALTGAVADSALREMLTGGRSIFIEGETAFGKVEQLVVLRAEPGEGRYHRTITEDTGSAEVETIQAAGTTDQHRWALDLGLNTVTSVSGEHRPGSLLLAGLAATRRLTTTTEVTHEHKDTVTAEHSGAAVQFVHDLRVTMEVYPYARLGHYSKHLPAWFPTPGPRAVDAPWRSEFELPGAIQSTVPKEDTIPLDGGPQRPIEQVADSLRDWQRLTGRQPGLAADAVVHVRPFAAPGLHAALNALAAGADGRPALRPRAGYQLRSATESAPLRANMRELLSGEGYVIPVAGDAVSYVRLTADLVDRELVRVLGGAPLKLDVNDTRTAKLTSDLKGELGFSSTLDIRALNAGTERGRPAVMISDTTVPIVPLADYNTTSLSTRRTEPAREVDGEQRYLVRVTPHWELRPVYRAKNTPAEWASAVRTGPDEPILIELDRRGLESLGLHDPGLPTPYAASTPARRSSSEDVPTSLADFAFRRTYGRLRSDNTWPGWTFSRSFASRGLGPEFRSDVEVPWPVQPVPGGLFGLTGTGELRSFSATDVQVHPLTKSGRTIGMTFLRGDSLRFDVRWAKGVIPGKEFTHYFGPGTAAFYDRASGSGVRRGAAPWPKDSFYISTHGEPGSFMVTLADGTTLRVPGSSFARTVAAAAPFRAAVNTGDRRAIALLVCLVAADSRPGGAAYDFQRTLEAEFGHRQPVVAATRVVDMAYDVSTVLKHSAVKRVKSLFTGSLLLDHAAITGMRDGGRWKVFAAGSAGLLGADTGDVTRYFTASEVRSAAVTDGGRTVGVSFQAEVAHERSAYGAEVPWPSRSFLVDVQPAGGEFRLRLLDGSRVKVDGAGLAKVAVESAAFHAAAADGPPASMVLLARPGADRPPGMYSTAPSDFREALSETFGFDRPVFVPNAVLSAPGDALNVTGWRRVTVSRVRDAGAPRQAASSLGVRSALPVDLAGLHEASEDTLEVIEFSSADVEFGVVHRDNRPVGVSFGVDEDRVIDEAGLSQPPERLRRTALYPAGVTTGTVQAEITPSPWTDNAFFAVTHSNEQVIVLNLKSGELVQVDGENYARMVASVDGFRQALAAGAGSVVLVSCAIAAGETSLAHDFQQTLEREFGYRQPVLGPTGWVALSPEEDSHVGSYVADGGQWLTFTSPTSDLLVQDHAGEPHVLNPATVPAIPLVHHDRVAGLSFRETRSGLSAWAEHGAPSGPWTDHTLFLDVSTDAGRFEVTSPGGRKVLLKAGQFARVVAESPSFRTAMGRRPDSITLLASWTAAPVHDVVAAEHFQRALAREHGHDLPVLAPAATVTPGLSERGTPQVLVRGGEFEFFPVGTRLSIGADAEGRSRFFAPGTIAGHRFDGAHQVPAAISFVPGAEAVPGPAGSFGLQVRTGPAGFVVTDSGGHDLSLDGQAFAATLARFAPFVEAMFHLDVTSDRPLVEEWAAFALSGPGGGALAAPPVMVAGFGRTLAAALGRDIPLLVPETTGTRLTWRRLGAADGELSLKDFLTPSGV